MNIAVLLMAGSGHRFQSEEPKQFVVVQGLPLFAYALSTLSHHKDIDRIILVIHRDYLEQVRSYCKENFFDKRLDFIEGGSTRQASVYCALLYMRDFAKDDDIVLIHDAARPLVSMNIISDNLDGAKQLGAVTTALHNRDTLIRVDEDHRLLEVLERTATYQVQTPQTFTYELLFSAHQVALSLNQFNLSDDAQIVQALPHSVHIVNGSSLNFKVTDPSDLELLKSSIQIGAQKDE